MCVRTEYSVFCIHFEHPFPDLRCSRTHHPEMHSTTHIRSKYRLHNGLCVRVCVCVAVHMRAWRPGIVGARAQSPCARSVQRSGAARALRIMYTHVCVFNVLTCMHTHNVTTHTHSDACSSFPASARSSDDDDDAV